MKTKHKYALGGLAFGISFPILSVSFLIFSQNYSLLDLKLMHQEHPLLYIIDTAPFILGFMAFVIGQKKEENIKQEILNTENTVLLRTRALSDKNESLEKEIREREIVEKKLVKASEEAIHAKNVQQRFLANMSHEIRTPLNSIIGFSKILSNSKLDSDNARYLETIKLSSNHLLSVVNDILDVSKINDGNISFEKTTINLKELIQSVMESLESTAKDKQISLTYDLFTEKDVLIKTDSYRLNQVLFNLLSNAIKFTSEGSVKLVVHHLECTSSEADLKLRFEVIDTGIGIEKENIEKVFEDFAQAETSTTRGYGGTGLGLSISKKIIELQNGVIGAESELGAGSNFWFEIEFEIGHEDEIESIHSLDNFQREKEIKLLIAEDNEVNRFLIKAVFDQWGEIFDITFANNGLEAYEKVQGNEFDLVIMDIQMPVKDGFESTEMIRSLASSKKSIPILALTADVLVEVKNKAFEVGMDEFLTKPIQPELLLSKIFKCINIEKSML